MFNCAVLTGGRLHIWWRIRCIDQITYPNSSASIDVQAASVRWDQLAATLLRVPRLLERKQPTKVTMANGKPGMRTSRGTLPAANPSALPAADSEDDVSEWEEQDEQQEEQQQEEDQDGTEQEQGE